MQEPTEPGSTSHTAETPPFQPLQEQTGLANEHIVWIVVGALAAFIILVGLVYNVVKRGRNDKSLDLDLESNYGSEEGSYAWDEGDNDEQSEDEADDREERKSLSNNSVKT